jgi:hypothetical protein
MTRSCARVASLLTSLMCAVMVEWLLVHHYYHDKKAFEKLSNRPLKKSEKIEFNGRCVKVINTTKKITFIYKIK